MTANAIDNIGAAAIAEALSDNKQITNLVRRTP